MKIAITADVHLTTQDQHPERFTTLENIFSSLLAQGIHTLIIAGDLFDASLRYPAEFESLCQRSKHQKLKLYVVPGNHDADLKEAGFTLPNLRVVAEPALVTVPGKPHPFLFAPYKKGKTMGEIIAPFRDRLPPGGWNLVGHGDWTAGLKAGNPYEPGFYMPLTRPDLDIYKPANVFLGHIHTPIQQPPVFVPGSPCGLDIMETGKRRILVYDTDTGMVDEQPVDTPVIYFNERFLVVPVEDEAAYMRTQVKERVQSWGLDPGDESKVQLRLRVLGFSADRSALLDVLKEEFAPYSWYEGQEPDLSKVSLSNDSERNAIAAALIDRVNELHWPVGFDSPLDDEIILDGLKAIYGE